jgi:pectate lyase
MDHAHDSTVPRHRAARRWTLASVAGTAAAAVALVLSMSTVAQAATLFTDNFDDGNLTGWSKSGGDWTVVSDGSPTAQQGNITSELARFFGGDNAWTNYSVQARVKATAFDGGGTYVGISARTSGATKFYRLALLSTNRAELQAVNGSSVTVIGGVNRTVATGTWYTLRIDVNGSSIAGFVDGAQIASGTNTMEDNGRIALQTFHATARFDDVTVSTIGSQPPPSSPPASPPSSASPQPSSSTGNPSPPPPSNGIVGWATQGGGTTGGNGGPVSTVTSLSALTSAVSSDSAKIVQVNGNFSCSADVRIGSNTTVIGVGSNSGLTGCGLAVVDKNNVIIRNMKIAKVQAGSGNGDAIHVDHGTHLWIDHNDLSSDTTSGTDFYDGLLDMTHAADYITVSWNKLHDHIKCSLVGHSDSNASEDTGHLRITYHHNLFSNCGQRNPRVRFADPLHVYNNYYVQTTTFDYSYGIATTENAGVLVENNYFENIAEPTHLSEGSSDPGRLVARGNVLVNSGPILTSGSVGSIPYSYTLENGSTVKASVTANAGTGKI